MHTHMHIRTYCTAQHGWAGESAHTSGLARASPEGHQRRLRVGFQWVRDLILTSKQSVMEMFFVLRHASPAVFSRSTSASSMTPPPKQQPSSGPSIKRRLQLTTSPGTAAADSSRPTSKPKGLTTPTAAKSSTVAPGTPAEALSKDWVVRPNVLKLRPPPPKATAVATAAAPAVAAVAGCHTKVVIQPTMKPKIEPTESTTATPDSLTVPAVLPDTPPPPGQAPQQAAAAPTPVEQETKAESPAVPTPAAPKASAKATSPAVPTQPAPAAAQAPQQAAHVPTPVEPEAKAASPAVPTPAAPKAPQQAAVVPTPTEQEAKAASPAVPTQAAPRAPEQTALVPTPAGQEAKAASPATAPAYVATPVAAVMPTPVPTHPSKTEQLQVRAGALRRRPPAPTTKAEMNSPQQNTQESGVTETPAVKSAPAANVPPPANTSAQPATAAADPPKAPAPAPAKASAAPPSTAAGVHITVSPEVWINSFVTLHVWLLEAAGNSVVPENYNQRQALQGEFKRHGMHVKCDYVCWLCVYLHMYLICMTYDMYNLCSWTYPCSNLS